MKKKKIILTVAIIATVVSGTAFAYNTAFHKEDNEIKVVGYKDSEVKNKNGYEISKIEGLEAQQWFDENTLVVLRNHDVNIGVSPKIEESNAISTVAEKDESYTSLYDLNTKTYKDYKDIDLNEKALSSISPSRRYLVYPEPREVPEVISEEGQEPVLLTKMKRNVLDLTTGETISRDIDKTLNFNEAEYKFINDDYIFVNYGAHWKVLDKQGNVVKKGNIEFDTNDYWNYAPLIDSSELKVEGDNIVGSFYYTKEYRTADNSLNDAIYSMDISTNKETLIGKYDTSARAQKQGNIIAMEVYNNNGEAQDGIYVNRTFGFKIIDKAGKPLQDFELPKERNFTYLTLSNSGEKCAFVECDSFINEIPSPLNDAIKVMDVKTGEIKEIANVSNLVDGIENAEILKKKGNGLSNLSWDSTATSLIFDLTYTSKEDGQNHISTYIVTFDK